MTNTFYATMTSKGQVTVPVEIRRMLDLKTHDKLAFAVENGMVRIKRVNLSLVDVFGLIRTPDGIVTGDFEDLIDEAVREESERLTKEFLELS
ncbi:hypothetical protein BH24CHL4_BH24CHL4_26820 [soil metagenome]